MSIINFFNRKEDEAPQSDKTGTSGIQNVSGVCDTPLDSQYTPDRIDRLGKRDFFVFGSNLAGRHGGGAARIAMNRFGAVYGQGKGLQGNSYAIPTMQGGIETIKPYVDRFIEFAKHEKALTFYVTKIGCGIAGFQLNEIAPLFKDALAVTNIRLPKEFVDLIDKDYDEIPRADLLIHSHGVTRTFADLVIAKNDDVRFRSPDEVISFLKQYFDRFKRNGDDVAFIAVRIFWNILHEEKLFKNGKLDVDALKTHLLGFTSHCNEVDKAYDAHCREKLFNIIVYLNQFRRYSSSQELINDIKRSKITHFSHCGPNRDYIMSPIRAGEGYPLYYFEKFFTENWRRITNADGTLDPYRLDELMFNKHERGLRKYGLEAVLSHDYEPYPCWGAYTPILIGTGPVYIKLHRGGYATSCGEGAGPNHIPHSLEYTITAEILEADSRYECIHGHYIPKNDISLPILGTWGKNGIINFDNLEEKRIFIEDLRKKTGF